MRKIYLGMGSVCLVVIMVVFLPFRIMGFIWEYGSHSWKTPIRLFVKEVMFLWDDVLRSDD